MRARTRAIALEGPLSWSRDGAAARVIELAGLPADGDGIVLDGVGTWDPPTTPLDADGQGVPYVSYGFAAQMAEVEVDTALGTVKVLAIEAAHDVGRAMNPTLVEGQIHGGIAQGLGLALMEEFIPGRTENLHDYLIPTVGRHAAYRHPPDRGSRARGPLRRQGRGRARADRHRARHLLRRAPCLRRARDPRARCCRTGSGRRCGR